MAIDYSKLRDQTLGSGQDEEAVTVNTRALIDKVLARYSGEHTTIRELIQNAADASATHVTIKFETLPSPSVPLPSSNDQSALLKHTVRHHTLRRLLVSNNGVPFAESDWSRLKRIAEGNPDETKIGAFGVGFYSVFSECDNPFVMSGDQSMAFYWKGNSLFTRKGQLPPNAAKDTSFVLDYRNSTTAIPVLMSICQFLSTSLTFVSLEGIELWLDDWNLFSLKKKFAPSEAVDLPKDINTKTKEGLLQVTGVSTQSAQIDASWMNIVGWTPAPERPVGHTPDADPKPQSLRQFFSRLTNAGQSSAAAKKAAKEEEAAQQAISENITGMSQATVFVRVSTVSIKSRVTSSFASELERATKKPPPKTTKIEILTSSHDETEASMSTVTGAASSKVASAVLGALPTKNGRIFIGFPTAQTTGLLAHISAPSIIPTVERENIDLNARYVRTWNQELLSVAGVACRITYASEMARLQKQLGSPAKNSATAIEAEKLEKALPTATHILKQFAFKESTPLSGVGQIVEEAFWTCARKTSIEMISSCGILPSDEVRIASETLSFVKGLPVVPDQVMKQASGYIAKLRDFGFLTDITNTDIKRELERQALSEAQLEEFLKWAGKKTRCHELDTESALSLFESTVVNLAPDATGASQGLLELRQIKTFLNPSRIAPELPLPPTTIPLRFTKSVTRADLESFGWEELQLVPWLRWIMDHAVKGTALPDANPMKSSGFAQQLLTTLSKGYDSLSQSSKSTVTELLTPHAIVPTKLGMRRPVDAYFPSVRLFDDLPVVRLDGVKEKFLKTLGVRKTIELSVIFERLMDPSDETEKKASWSHIDLIKYLVSVWNDIPQSDIELLKKTALCPAETSGDPRKPTGQRFKVLELYEPKDSLRELGLPIVQWPGVFNAFSGEGKFLKLLGLRAYPSAPDLIQIIADANKNADVQKYEAGLRYFVENHYQNNYTAFDLSNVALPFLPVEGGEKRKVASPDQCYSNGQASVLGYHIIRTDLRANASKFGVRENPSILDCAHRLVQKPPTNDADAKMLFSYFANRLPDITPNLADRLGSAVIVPVKQKSSAPSDQHASYRLAAPNSCFLGDDEEYGDIFDYVDFGQEPNVFLLKVGSKHEPSITELTRLLIREPARIFASLKVEKYMNLLRKLHVNVALLKKDKTLWKEMKKAPFLLAYHERAIDAKNTNSTADVLEVDDADLDEQSFIKEWHLRSAGQVVIVNDLISFSLFRNYLLAAPQEESIEELYSFLGTPNVSDLIEEEPRLGPPSRDQRSAEHLHELIIERSRLFLHEQHPSSILHDVKWLEKNLAVQTVHSVSLRRSLKGHSQSHLERRSAALTLSRDGKTRFTLAITSDYDVWQVSQEVVGLLVGKQKTQNAFVFEMFLTTSLYKLRSRGYDVDRVLKRKQREQRAAELERQRQAEEEKKRARQAEEKALVAQATTLHSQPRESDDAFVDAGERSQSSGDQRSVMPGAFHDSPDRPERSAQQQQQPRGLFSSIRSGLGLDDGRTLSEGIDNFLRRGGQTRPMETTPQGPTPASPHDPGLPPPYSRYDPRALQTTGQPNAEHVSPPSSTNHNLKSAIAASRSYNSSSLFSQPETNQVKEVSSYCDTKPGHDLRLISQTTNGMHVYLDQTITADQAPTFVEQNHTGLDLFESVLLEIASIFGLRKDSLHIYFDIKGDAIAFNRSGAIFCNYRYFAQLHLQGVQDPETFARSEINAMVYWWVTTCHELAHNIVRDHSSNHSYYTEHFVMEFFPAMANKAMERLYRAGQAVSSRANSGSGGALTGVERAFS